MIYVDPEELEIPCNLQQRLERATQELLALQNDEERPAYITSHSNLWRDIRPCLARLTGRNENDCKCWYCESKGPGFAHHVDHFRPKNRVRHADGRDESGYWWLAFDPTNYRLSCQRCNTGAGKHDQFPLAGGSQRADSPLSDLEDEIPLLLDPTRAGDHILLAYSEDGKAYSHPRSPAGSFPAIRAEVSVGVYDLNHVAKVEARKQVWLKCSRLARLAKRAYHQLLNGPNETQKVAAERFRDICQEILEKVSISAEYSAMARYCFRGTGEDIISALI